MTQEAAGSVSGLSAVAGATMPALRLPQPLRLLFSRPILALLDQTLVSAMNFAVIFLLGNWAGLEQVGAYAIGSSIIILCMGVQDALVTRPYTIKHCGMSSQAGSYAFGALVLSLGLALATALLVATVAVVLSILQLAGGVTAMVWTLAWVTPLAAMREFARRFSFAHLNVGRVLLLDIIVVVCIALGLIWLGLWHGLSAASALAVIGVSCGVGVIVWFALNRGFFDAARLDLRLNLGHSWSLGKWLFSAKMALEIQGYSTQWLSMAIAGPLATGIFAACASLVAFANPLLHGFINFMGPKSAQVFSVHGNSGVRRQAVIDAALLTAMMAAFCALLVAFGDTAIAMLFPSAAGYGAVLVVLGFASMAGAVGVPPSTALSIAGRPGAFAAVTAAMAVLNLALVWWLLEGWGLLGAAFGVLAAETVGSAARWAAFLRFVPAQAPAVSANENPL